MSWFRPGPGLLIGADAGCYARVARDLSERPLLDFARVTLGGVGFFEHPPLGFWIESLVFRIFGATVPAALGLAHAYACLTLLLVGLAGKRLADGWVGAWCMVGLLVLPGFLHESQVAMLEQPLAAAVALGLFALSGMKQRPRSSIGWFAAALALAFWVKGPPALVLLGLLAAMAALSWVPRRSAVLAAIAGLAAVALSALAFEALRSAMGLEPFFSRYLQRQVVVSFVDGRHNPSSDPFFYVGPLVSWYLPGLIALAGAAIALRRRAFPVTVAGTGAILWAAVVVGFSIPSQKADWYIHFGMVGAALVIGAVLSLIPQRAAPGLTVAAAVFALCWPAVVHWLPVRLSEHQQRVLTIQQLQLPAGAERAVADCSEQGAWVNEHLMGFMWRATRVECAAPAPWRFDGSTLAAAPARGEPR